MKSEKKISVISRIKRFIHNTAEIVPNVYQITYSGANVVLIAEEQLTLIDTGLREGATHLVEFIRHLGRSPEEISLIILTHNHIDHIGGLAELKKLTTAKVAIHKADVGERKHPSAVGSRYRTSLTQFTSKLHSVFYVMPEDVDIKLEGGEILEPLGGLEIIHTPGHTPGSISLYSKQHKLLVVGDLLRKRRKMLYLPPKMVSSDLKEGMESVKKVSAYDINIMCFGHGLPLYEDVIPKMKDLINRDKV
jgi:glyoxylase-like metal-dependent hydrolase (beta-lactamase superfamily II)